MTATVHNDLDGRNPARGVVQYENLIFICRNMNIHWFYWSCEPISKPMSRITLKVVSSVMKNIRFLIREEFDFESPEKETLITNYGMRTQSVFPWKINRTSPGSMGIVSISRKHLVQTWIDAMQLVDLAKENEFESHGNSKPNAFLAFLLHHHP